jgi:hypothetical protein
MTTAAWILAGVVLWALVALGIALLLGRVVRMRDRQVPGPPEHPGHPERPRPPGAPEPPPGAPPPGPPRQRGPAERPRHEDG